MAQVRLNKLDAARRQIDAAIRIKFSGEDPVAVHGLTAAGHRIIRDICEARGDVESYLRLTDWIKPGFEKQFWKYYNATANFLKHADKDAEASHEFDDETTDFMLVLSAKWYSALGHKVTPEMNVFGVWWLLQNPNTIKPEMLAVFDRAGLAVQIETLKRDGQFLTRSDWLKMGRILLQQQIG